MSNTPTYSPAPLLAAAEACIEGEPTHGAVAEILGVADRTVSRWRNGQQVAEATADKVAIHLGYHPCLLWAEWWANCPAPDYDDAEVPA